MIYVTKILILLQKTVDDLYDEITNIYMLSWAGQYFRDFDLPTGTAFSCAVFMLL